MMEGRRRRNGRQLRAVPRRRDGTYVKPTLRGSGKKRGKVLSRKMIGGRKRKNVRKRRVRWKRTVEKKKGKTRVRVRTRYGRVIQRPYRYRSHTPNTLRSLGLIKQEPPERKVYDPPAPRPARTRAGRKNALSTIECFSRYGRVSRPPVRLMQPCPSPPKLMRLSVPDPAPKRRKAGKKYREDLVVATTVQNMSIAEEDQENVKKEEKEMFVPVKAEPVRETESAEVQDTSCSASDSLAVEVVKMTEECETDSGGEFNPSASPSLCSSGYSIDLRMVGCEATATIGTNGEELDDPSKTPFSWDGSTSSGVSLRVSAEEERPKPSEEEYLEVSPQTDVEKKDGEYNATISTATKEEMIRECAKALEGYSDEEEAQEGCLIAAEPVDSLQCSGEEVQPPELYMDSVAEDKLPIAVQFSRLCEEYAQTEEQPPVDLEFERIGCDSLVVMNTDHQTTEQPIPSQDGVLDLNADSDKDFRSVSPCTSYLSSEDDVGDSALSEDDLGGCGSSSEDPEETIYDRDSVSSEIDFDEEDERARIPQEDLSKDKMSYRSGEDSDREEDRALSQESERDTSDTDSYRESEEDRSSCSSFVQHMDEDSCAAVENALEAENPAAAPPVEPQTEDSGLGLEALRSLMLEQVKKICDKCVYCNHAKRIAVNGQQLLSHLQEEHSVSLETAPPEELKAKLSETYINFADGDRQYECFRCIKSFCLHTELCVHNRKCHQNSILCIMCKRTFRSYSELVCHLCSGSYLPEDTSATTYRCCLCGPAAAGCSLSAFRLMVHLRRRHVTCDVCLQEAEDQQDLANHIRIHKLPHLCHHCGIAYRNKHDMKKHMFWKHGTESVLCKKCLQRKWPHQYHFCVPPDVFHCDKCDSSFSKAVALRVHTRMHDLNYPYSCKECREQFISKKLLNKHQKVHKQTVEDEMQAQCVEEIKEGDNLPTSIPVHNELVGDDSAANMSTEEIGSVTTGNSCCRFEISSIPALNLSSDGEDSDTEDSADEDTTPSKSSQMELNSKTSCIDEDMLKEGVGISEHFSEILAAVSTLESAIMKEHDYCIIAAQVHDDIPGPDGDKKVCPAAPVAKVGKARRRRKVRLEIVERLTSSSSDSSSDSSSSCSCSSCCDSSDSESSSESSCASRTRIKNSPSLEQQNLGGEEGAMALECGNTAEKYSINESDLETDEPESDSEDFYEEFPEQKGSKLVSDNHQDTATSQGEGKDQSVGELIVVARKRAATSLIVDMNTEDPNRTLHQKTAIEPDAVAHRRYSRRSRVCKKFSDEWCGGEDLEQGAGHRLVIKRKTRAGEPCALATNSIKTQSDMAVSRKRVNSGKLLGGPPRKKARTEPHMDNNQRLYCYCRKPHDPESRMIGCDGKNCKLEWFHFDCVNIFIAPKGKWYCPDCSSGGKPRYKRSDCDRRMGL